MLNVYLTISKVLGFINIITDPPFVSSFTIRKHLIAHCNATVLWQWPLHPILALGTPAALDSSRAVRMCKRCHVKWCPWVRFKGADHSEQSGKIPVRARQGDERSGDPGSPGVRIQRFGGPTKEKWLGSGAEQTSPGRQGREGFAQTFAMREWQCRWEVMSR